MKLFEKLFKFLNSTKRAYPEYNLTFEHEDNGNWYIVLPNWPASHANLQMVAGADKLLDQLSQGKRFVHVTVSKEAPNNPTNSILLVRYDDNENLDYGAEYSNYTAHPTYSYSDLWLCPVTLFVLGEYPDEMHLYNISATDNN